MRVNFWLHHPVKLILQNKNVPNRPTLSQCKLVSIKGLWTYENTRPRTDWWQYVVYQKCLDRFQEWMAHIKTTKKGHINVYPEWVILQSNWKITFNNNYFNYYNIVPTNDTMHCNTRSHFNNCWVLIFYQIKVHNKCPKCPPSETAHATTRLITDCPAFPNISGHLTFRGPCIVIYSYNKTNEIQ